MKDHYYELKYFYGGRELSMKFSGDVNLQALQENLKDFLSGAGWTANNVAKLFNDDVPEV